MRRVFEVEPDWEETARRVRAAAAYAGMKAPAAAAALKVSEGSYYRVIGTKGAERRSVGWKDLMDFAERCGLPRDWFTADFNRLGEIVTEPLVTQSGGAVAAARTARARRALELTEEAASHQPAEIPPHGQPGRSRETNG